MARHWPGDKPLLEQMLTLFFDTWNMNMKHETPMSEKKQSIYSKTLRNIRLSAFLL